MAEIHESLTSSSAMRSAQSSPLAFHVDDKVEARFMQGKMWFPGSVSGVGVDGSYSVHYDDGEEEHQVPADCVRALVSESDVLISYNYAIGDSVEGLYMASQVIKSFPNPDSQHVTPDRSLACLLCTDNDNQGGSKWFPGKIISVNPNGSYGLKYSDGDEEKEVPDKYIRYSSPVRAKVSNQEPSPTEGSPRPLRQSSVETDAAVRGEGSEDDLSSRSNGSLAQFDTSGE